MDETNPAKVSSCLPSAAPWDHALHARSTTSSGKTTPLQDLRRNWKPERPAATEQAERGGGRTLTGSAQAGGNAVASSNGQRSMRDAAGWGQASVEGPGKHRRCGRGRVLSAIKLARAAAAGAGARVTGSLSTPAPSEGWDIDVNRPNLAWSASWSLATRPWAPVAGLAVAAPPVSAVDAVLADELAIAANGAGSAAPESEQPCACGRYACRSVVGSRSHRRHRLCTVAHVIGGAPLQQSGQPLSAVRRRSTLRPQSPRAERPTGSPPDGSNPLLASAAQPRTGREG